VKVGGTGGVKDSPKKRASNRKKIERVLFRALPSSTEKAIVSTSW